MEELRHHVRILFDVVLTIGQTGDHVVFAPMRFDVRELMLDTEVKSFLLRESDIIKPEALQKIFITALCIEGTIFCNRLTLGDIINLREALGFVNNLFMNKLDNAETRTSYDGSHALNWNGHVARQLENWDRLIEDRWGILDRMDKKFPEHGFLTEKPQRRTT